MERFKDFIKDVWYFILHIPNALLFIIAYLFGVRPYRVMARMRNYPDSKAEYFTSTLLPPHYDSTSWEAREYAISHFSDFSRTCFKFYLYDHLEPMPCWKYLLNDVLLPS